MTSAPLSAYARGPSSAFGNSEGTGSGAATAAVAGGGNGAGGGAASSSSNGNSSPGSASPNYLKWSESLHVLLNDGIGVDLLLKYLEQEDPDCFYMLRFWLAVRGSHQQPNQEQLNKCILAIYKGLFNKIKGGINDDLRRLVTQRIREAQSKNGLLDAKVFTEACKAVEAVMNDRMYPNFLTSDLYLSYVRGMQLDDTRATSADDNELPKNFSQALPVVNEDEELELSFDACRNRSTTYSCASTMLLRDHHNLRVHHLSYNPVSRQDSEVQSLSSGARTDSLPDLSLDDASGVFGSSTGSTYAQKRKQMRLNRNTDLIHIHEPRSSLPGIQEKASAPEPAKFMNTLVSKLEKIIKERENLECVGLKLESIDGGSEKGAGCSGTLKTLEDDDDQEILDRHVSRVWNDQTPKRSPCLGTPVRPKSPETRRARSLHGSSPKDTTIFPSASCWAPSSWSCRSGYLRKKDKDLASLFSNDSGNGTDRKSASDYGGEAGSSSDPRYSGHYTPSIRTWAGSRRTMTDSGVSVAGSIGMVPLQRSRDRTAPSTSWVDRRMPTAKSRSVFASHCSSKNKSEYLHSKSGVPAQPFMADTNMPPYPYYSIDSQTTVEEATRRLEEWKGTRDASQLEQSDGGSQATSQRSFCETTEFTSVVYNFSDENVPYLLKVPARPITLKMYKDHAPKKGNFRYFFQTECEELGGDTPIFEEITDNDCVLPLWKNKVISKITML